MSERSIPGLKVVLLNLERSADRRQAMQNQLSDLQIAFEWIRAIDGKARWAEIADKVSTEAFDRNIGRGVLPGEVGCYLSHLQAWNFLLESDDDVLLVLEDDIVFGDEFVTAVELAIEHRRDWDFLKLNKIRAKHPIRQKAIGDYAPHAYPGPATGLGAYLIQRHTIEKLLPRMLPITRPIDHELDRIHVYDFRHLGLEPFPSHVEDGNISTITGVGFSAVRKRPWFARLPSYLLRVSNLVGKIWYLHRTRRLYGITK